MEYLGSSLFSVDSRHPEFGSVVEAVDTRFRNCQSVAQRVPVLVCITDTVFEQALEVANEAATAGAEAVVAAPPYY